MIRLRKPAGPYPLLPETFGGDPPVFRQTLRALVGRDPTFMADQRVAQPAVPEWSALDAVIEAPRENGVAA